MSKWVSWVSEIVKIKVLGTRIVIMSENPNGLLSLGQNQLPKNRKNVSLSFSRFFSIPLYFLNLPLCPLKSQSSRLSSIWKMRLFFRLPLTAFGPIISVDLISYPFGSDTNWDWPIPFGVSATNIDTCTNTRIMIWANNNKWGLIIRGIIRTKPRKNNFLMFFRWIIVLIWRLIDHLGYLPLWMFPVFMVNRLLFK